MKHTVIVAGGGAAGLSAALFLARANVDVLVLDNGRSQLATVKSVPNYPAVEAVSGLELLERMKKQAVDAGAVLVQDTVTAAALTPEGVVLTTASNSYTAQHLVIACHKNVSVFVSGLDLHHNSPFIVVNNKGESSVAGVWAAGVSAGLVPGHAIMSAGDGAKVAIHLIAQLRGEAYKDHSD